MITKFRNYIRRKIKGENRDETIERLKKTGLKIGKKFNMQQDCIIDGSHCWLISIGDNVTLAPRVFILAHDASTKMYLNYTKIGLVRIGNNVFIGANSVILPNVRIGDNVIIGANSIVSKNIPENSVVVGNPARVIGKTDEYISKNKDLMKTRPVFSEEWTTRSNITQLQKDEMIKRLEDGIGFVE